MPPKSPPMAFQPSPADAPLLRSPDRSRSPVSPGRLELGRLSDALSPLTSPPSLSQQSLAMSRHSSTASAASASSAYMEQSRVLLQRQRKAFEDERALFADERALWETERVVLQARIKELEWTLEAHKHSTAGDAIRGRQWEHRGTFGGPVSANGSVSSGDEKFWEGPSRAASITTRTFNDATSLNGRLHSISESAPPHIVMRAPSGHDTPVSPGKVTPSGHGIDISLVNSKLDGIMLKATAVSPSLLHTVTEADMESSPDSLYANLTKNAGHTPRPGHSPQPSQAVTATVEKDVLSNGDATPTQPHQRHMPTVVVAETSDNTKAQDDDSSDDDPALRPPLSLNGHGGDISFLEQLDSRLDEVVRRSQQPSPSSLSPAVEKADPLSSGTRDSGGVDTRNINNNNNDDAEDGGGPPLKLRFKRSMNFGAAFGTKG